MPWRVLIDRRDSWRGLTVKEGIMEGQEKKPHTEGLTHTHTEKCVHYDAMRRPFFNCQHEPNTCKFCLEEKATGEQMAACVAEQAKI
jgi:hypothetical protein